MTVSHWVDGAVAPTAEENDEGAEVVAISEWLERVPSLRRAFTPSPGKHRAEGPAV